MKNFRLVPLRVTKSIKKTAFKKYMLFSGWEVRNLRIVKNCDRGTATIFKSKVKVFTVQTDPKPANNMFIVLSCSKLVLIKNGFVHATLS